jgi:hypothetical protein
MSLQRIAAVLDILTENSSWIPDSQKLWDNILYSKR